MHCVNFIIELKDEVSTINIKNIKIHDIRVENIKERTLREDVMYNEKVVSSSQSEYGVIYIYRATESKSTHLEHATTTSSAASSTTTTASESSATARTSAATKSSSTATSAATTESCNMTSHMRQQANSWSKYKYHQSFPSIIT
ncbi:hypothetical protein EB796_014895 [Bugula neritina]|uniref:Uncharacterized protein n=1 Tax=Bugula neritina TaxID=10212 RepID=A0A7J7JMF3_BUGNE|nr:hypothetical protein EB796_014895 [Bugula neritina]